MSLIVFLPAVSLVLIKDLTDLVKTNTVTPMTSKKGTLPRSLTGDLKHQRQREREFARPRGGRVALTGNNST